MQIKISTTLQILLVQFDGHLLVPFVAGSETAGIACQTARNKLAAGTYPISTVLNGSRRFIHIEDLANYIDSLRSDSSKPKRGRPTKASKIQAARIGGEA